MPLILRQDKGSKLTIAEMDGNLTYLDEEAKKSLIKTVTFVVDGGDTTPSTGEYSSIVSNFNGTITSWTITSDIAGSTVVDIWKANGAKPTVANTITASAKPTLSSANYATGATLTGWTTSITENDVLTINIDSISTLKRVTLQLNISL